jgi:hypothetical protein
MDGCVFGWNLWKDIYHTGIMVQWRPEAPELSIIFHFGMYAGMGFPWNLLDTNALENGAEGRLETVASAWKRWLTTTKGNNLYFNQRLRVSDERLQELKSMISSIPAGRSLEITVSHRYSLFRHNCQWFTRKMLPLDLAERVVIQSDRPWAKSNLPRLQGHPALPVILEPHQILITDWTAKCPM